MDNGFKIRNGVNIGVLSADPANPVNGDMYYNSTSNKYREYKGGAWHNAVDEDSTQTLSNKTFDNTTSFTVKDANFTIQDDADTSKQVKFQASGLTTATTRTLTVPDANTTIVGTDATQSLSNKTLDNTTVETIKDTNFTIQDDGDTSKQAKFDASGITTATTRTLGLPDVNSNLLARTSTDQGANRVTNKDLEAGSTKIVDGTDTTKKIAFQASGATTGTTLTIAESQSTSQSLAVPNVGSGDSLVTNNTTAILSSKQLQFSSTTDSTSTGTATTLAAFTTGVIRLTNASLVSVAGIPAGSSAQFLIIENKTGNQVTINNEDTGATAANRIKTGTGANLSMPNDATFVFLYDSTVSRWQLTAGSGSGSGSGTKNYLTAMTASLGGTTANTGNGDFEFGSTAGWSLGTTGTLTNAIPSGTPTFGSGASGNLSISAVNSGQLAGQYSLSYASSAATTVGNMVASNAFFIDAEDQAKVLTWKFAYKAQTNPGNANWSGTSSNSFAVAVWDVTNFVWLNTTANFAMTQSSGIGQASGTFQTGASTAQLRLVVYNANATTGAATVYFDDFSVGPQSVSIGSLAQANTVQTLSGSGNYTTPSNVYMIRVKMAGGGAGGQGSGSSPVDATSGTLSTFGTSLLTANGGSRAVGTSAAGGAGGTATINSPAIGTALTGGQGQSGTALSAAGLRGLGGFGGDTPYFGGGGKTAQYTGNGTAGTANTGGGGQGGGNNGAANVITGAGGGSGGFIDAFVFPTPGQVFAYSVGGGGAGATGATLNGAAGAAGTIVVEEFYRGQNVQMSADTDTRVVAFAINSCTPSGTPSTSDAVINFGAAGEDTHSGWNGTTTYTVPVSGLYKCHTHIEVNGASGTAITLQVAINVNGSTRSVSAPIITSNNTRWNADVDGIYTLKAGDLVTVHHNYAGTITTPSWGSGTCQFAIQRLSGPSVIAATESVSAAAVNTSAQSLTNNTVTTLTGWTKVKDTHSSFSTSGVYTIPVSGSYRASVSIGALPVSSAVGIIGSQMVQAGSVSRTIRTNTPFSTTGNNTSALSSFTFNCLAGDTITLQGVQDNGNTVSLDNTAFCYFSIERIGN